MDATQFFEPSFRTFVGNFVGFCVRYFAVAGGFYWLVHVAFKHKWLAYRVQATFPSLAEVGYEIAWSMMNTACSGVSTLLIYALVRGGKSSMYFAMADYGWVYFFLSIALCIVGYDTWIYWQHRFLHTPVMFRHVHWVHHRVGNPTAFATFAQHPVETFMGNAFFILCVVFLPLHPLALGAAGAYMFFYGIIGHLGYEFYPEGFPRRRLLGWLQTATYHNMHHRHVKCNYSAWFTYWDHIMGTNHPAYDATFDAIKARVAAAAAPMGVEEDRRVAA